MNKIITCKEFNRRGFKQHRKAVEEWRNELRLKPSTYPSVLFYIFHKQNGEPRNHGYVLTTKHGGKWFKTKRQAYNHSGE
jgi:hypothetical protein